MDDYDKKGIEQAKKLKTVMYTFIAKMKEENVEHDYLRELVSDIEISVMEWGVDGVDSIIERLESEEDE